MQSTVLTVAKFDAIKAVIIDLDGTMIDTAGDFLSAINAMRSDFALAPIDKETVMNFVGKGSENLIFRALSLDFNKLQVDLHFSAAMASYQKHYLAINGNYSSVYPEVIEGLQAFKACGLKMACVTNKPIASTLPLLEKKQLLSYFEIIYGGDSLSRKKPHPAPFLQVCVDFALRPDQVLAIGDSSNDAQAARAAGCKILLLPYGYNHGESIQNVESDGIVKTLFEAAQFFTAKAAKDKIV